MYPRPEDPTDSTTSTPKPVRRRWIPHTILGVLALALAAVVRVVIVVRGYRARYLDGLAQLAQARLAARRDPLTDLPNRRVVMELLAQDLVHGPAGTPSPGSVRDASMDAGVEAVDWVGRWGPVAMLGLLDLDHFKQVNDVHGHMIGDHLLTVIAARLEHAMNNHNTHGTSRNSDSRHSATRNPGNGNGNGNGNGIAARLAGDEFVLLWWQRPDDPTAAAAAVLTAALAPVTVGDSLVLRPTASLGIALAGAHLHGTDLLSAADAAMYEIKFDRRYQSTDPPVHVYTGRYPPATDRRHRGRDLTWSDDSATPAYLTPHTQEDHHDPRPR